MINSLEMKIKKKALGELVMFSLEKRRVSRGILFPTVINRTSAILLFHQRVELSLGRSKNLTLTSFL